MKLENLAPAVVHFSAGIAGAAAVNLVTTAFGSSASAELFRDLLISAVPWAVLSWVLVVVGAHLERARREVDLLTSPVLSAAERQEIRAKTIAGVRGRLHVYLLVALACLVIGIALLIVARATTGVPGRPGPMLSPTGGASPTRTVSLSS
jgi:hypothetical protein